MLERLKKNLKFKDATADTDGYNSRKQRGERVYYSYMLNSVFHQDWGRRKMPVFCVNLSIWCITRFAFPVRNATSICFDDYGTKSYVLGNINDTLKCQSEAEPKKKYSISQSAKNNCIFFFHFVEIKWSGFLQGLYKYSEPLCLRCAKGFSPTPNTVEPTIEEIYDRCEAFLVLSK
eukprot:gene4049-2901_t